MLILIFECCVFFYVRKLRTVLIYGLVFLLVFFWTVPVAFTSTLVSLQNLTKVAPFLKPGEGPYVTNMQVKFYCWLLLTTAFFVFLFLVLELSGFVKGAIEGFLSSLALVIFFAILPLVSIHYNTSKLLETQHHFSSGFFARRTKNKDKKQSCLINVRY